MERKVYDYDGLLRLLAAIFDLAHREAKRGDLAATGFLDYVVPNRCNPAIVNSKQSVNDNCSQLDEAENGTPNLAG